MHLGVENDTAIMHAIMEEDDRADCDDGDEDTMWELEDGEWGLGGIKGLLQN